MKIVLAFPQKDKRTGFAIKKAFRALGHTVAVVDAKTEPGKLFGTAKDVKPDLILCSRTAKLLDGIVKCKETLKNIKIACWNTDTHNSVELFSKVYGGENVVKLFKLCDVLYTVGESDIEMFSAEGIHTKWLPQAIDPDFTYKPKLERNYQHDISFLCHLTKYHQNNRGRSDLVKHIKKFLCIYMKKAFLHGATKTYYLTRINLGNNQTGKRNTISVRDLKIMGSGGFLLTSYQDGAVDWLGAGDNFVVYTDAQDCVNKIFYYLSAPDIRERIAEKGFELVQSKHKYIDRVQQIVKDFKSCAF